MKKDKQVQEKKFDTKGLLCAIVEIGKSQKIPTPEDLSKLILCSVCLGANVPNQKSYPEDSWCCGSVCDSILPFWGICEGFKLDPHKLKELVEKVRPDGTEEARSYGHYSDDLLKLCE